MQVNELRIGNCVKCIALGTFIKVDLHFFNEIYDHENNGDDTMLDWYQGIPLTSEILVKCGFNCYIIDESEPAGGVYYSKKLSEDKYCDLSFIDGDKNGFMDVCLFPYENNFRYKYLHQLQNLYFALTGEELEVNL